MDQAQAQFGVRVGLHRASSSYSIDGESISTGWLNRLAFGVSYEQKVNDQLSFRPEILLSHYGVSFLEQSSPDESSTFQMNFIQLPLLLKYYATNSLFFEVGPYLAHGVGNIELKFCPSLPDGEFCETRTLDFDSKGEESLKPFDFGASLGLGYRVFKGISLGVRYNLGLANLGNDFAGYKNKSLLVSLSYDF